MKHRLVLAIGLIVAACATTEVVPDAANEDVISSIKMSCSNPYELAQDCSAWSGAKRNIVLDGFEIKVAGSGAGDVILVMDAHIYARSALEGLTLNIGPDYHSVASNNSVEAVGRLLRENGRKILAIKPLMSFGNIDGYVLELDSDGYELLKPYTVE